MLEILIPTCLRPDDLALIAQRKELHARTKSAHGLITSCQKGSAAYNRNLCLRRCRRHTGIMLDDDVHGFYDGWETDLMAPLREPDVMVVSARLMTREGLVAQTCSRCYDLEPEEIEVKPGQNCVLPTAAIAFRNVGIMFDEHFLGSGFEDGDWCFQYLQRFPNAKFIQSNRCKLTHLNEQKGQAENWERNQAYLLEKWKRG